MMNKADHSGHRDRLRTKYLENGVESLAPHEVIELLLYNAVPYRDTNNMAKSLLDRFGSLGAVMDASLEMLMQAGLTRNQALFLKLIPDVTRLYMLDSSKDHEKIIDLDTVPAYLQKQFIGRMNGETVFLILVDKKMKEVYSGVLSKGSFNASEISLRRLVSLALNHNAVGAILAHNHPSGFAMPSPEDYAATVTIAKSLNMVGVQLLDHFILSDGECVSMNASHMLD